MKDAKHVHKDIINRPADSWQDGWPRRAESWGLGFVWGCVFILAVAVFCY